jgi:Xaa-Pro aminopeptidase
MGLSQEFYKKNRQKIGKFLENSSLAIVFSGREMLMSADANYTFFTNNNFYYLTGILEPEVVLIVAKNDQGILSEKLFVPEIDLEQEKWVGKKINQNDAKKASGIEEIYTINEMPKFMKLYKDVNTFYFDSKVSSYQSFKTQDDQLKKIINKSDLKDLHPIFAKMRVIKTPEEIEMIRKANAITKKAFRKMSMAIKPGVYEFELAALFEYYIKIQGAEGLAFESIVAAGENATTLHYVSKKSKIQEKELILFDIGARLNGYCGDVSRTIGVNDNLTRDQEKALEIVRSVQEELIKAYKPKVLMSELQELTRQLLLERCKKAGFKPKNNDISNFYCHGIGHSLGLDTHDIRPQGDLELKPGMVMTVEPGIYMEEYGIGIRIEDDLVITASGCDVL